MAETAALRIAHAAAEHAHLGAELLHAELELLDCLLRRVHRNGGRRRESTFERLEAVGDHDVVAVDYRAPCRVVRNAVPGRGQTPART